MTSAGGNVSFDVFYKELIKKSIHQKGKSLEVSFKEVLKDFFIKDPGQSVRFSEAYLWGEWEHRFGPDMGIDLVAKEKESQEYWAIQCKFYSKDARLYQNDIKQFLGASSRSFAVEGESRRFEGRILVTTTEELSINLENLLKDQNPPCTVIDYQSLKNANVDWNIKEKTVSVRPQKNLRPYQKKAITTIREGFEKNSRGKLIMACGTGKTFTSVKIVEDLGSKRVLYLVPGLALLQQTVNEYSHSFEHPQRHLIVCSDRTIKTKNQDEEMSVINLGFASTSEPSKIERYLKGAANTDKVSFVFSTYQSLDKLEKVFQNGRILPFDLVLCDEAHRTTGIAGSHFNSILNERKVKRSKILFMTATEKVYGEAVKEKAKTQNVEVYSMDDSSYGGSFFEYQFTNAITDNFLTDYKVVILKLASGKKKEEFKKDKDYYNLIFHLDQKNIQDSFVDFCRKYKINKLIAFTNTIRHSKNEFTSKWGKEHGQRADSIDVKHVDGSHSGSEKFKKLEWLGEPDPDDKIRILSNAKCLTEGVDVPNINGILFLEPKSSQLEIVQAVGRAIRLSPDKEYGYIILPVIVPEQQDEYECLEYGDYKKIWQVLKALRSYDEKLNLEVNNVRFQDIHNWDDKKNALNKIDIVDGETLQTEELPEKTLLAKNERYTQSFLFNQQIRFKILDKVGDRDYINSWSEELPQAVEKVKEYLNQQEKQPEYQKHIEDLKASLKPVINPNISGGEIREILIQHILTVDIFESVFDDLDFTQHNPMARDLKRIAGRIFKTDTQKSITDELGFRSLEALKERAKSQTSFKDQKTFLLSFYETFYKVYNPKGADKLGIVYTPEELVNFMVRSADELLQKHFDRNLIGHGINLLDPCTGTGNFIYYLLHYLWGEYKDKKRLASKYAHEIFASEVSILSYYIASLCIEKGFFHVTGEYKTFPGIVYQDTLDNIDFTGSILENPKQYTHLFHEKVNQENIERRAV